MLAPLGSLDRQLDEMNIGFIGLGNMGAPMAENLAKAGLKLWGCPLASKQMLNGKNQLKLQGKPRLLSQCSQTGIFCARLQTNHSRNGEGTVFLVVPVDVQTARDVADMASAEGILPLDAPVSGGVGGVSSGTLTFMVGGSSVGFKKSRSVL